MIYIREAHPTDGWQVDSNIAQSVLYARHRNVEDRSVAASACSRNLNLSIPILVDDETDSADNLYRGWPERLYAIDSEGCIAYQGAKGPYGFDPEELNAFLCGQISTDSSPA